MSDIGEGLGTVVSGGLFARVLDPASGARERHAGDPENCLNCGTALEGAYCHACGQSGHVHRTIGAFWHDLMHGALHLDGKMWRTLPMLVLRPGRLTRRYIDGARARFVSPMALFLFSVFLMFAVFQILGISAPTDIEVPTELTDSFENGIDEAITLRDSRSAELAAMSPTDPLRADTQAQLSDIEAAIAGLQGIQSVGVAQDERFSQSFTNTGIDFIDNGIGKKWRENPSLMVYKLQANSYKFSWLLIPISIPFVWLMFVWKRRFHGYDHSIFVTYSLSFMTLLFVTLSLLSAAGVGGGWLLTIFATVTPWHIYRQLRGTYDLSRFSALWRLLVLLVFIQIILLLFLQALLLLGAF